MAEQEKVENDKGAPPDAPRYKRPGAKVLPWIVLVLVVVALGCIGFGVGRLFGTRGRAQTVAAAEPAGPQEPGESPKTGEGWYYDLDPVVANLNEPGVTRYARVALTLEVGPRAAQKETTASLDQKKPLLKHWLTLYLANQTLEEMRGEKNLLRMQAQILDGFNLALFPNTKPQIQRVFFKEFAIQ